MEEIVQKLKTARTMILSFEDLSLGYVPNQIEKIEALVMSFEKLDPSGMEDQIFEALTTADRAYVIRAYCFTRLHRGHKFLFLRE